MNLRFDSKRIYRLRRSLGLTQQEFAQLMPCAQSSVAQWEQGLWEPKGRLFIERLLELEHEHVKSERRPERRETK